MLPSSRGAAGLQSTMRPARLRGRQGRRASAAAQGQAEASGRRRGGSRGGGRSVPEKELGLEMEVEMEAPSREKRGAFSGARAGPENWEHHQISQACARISRVSWAPGSRPSAPRGPGRHGAALGSCAQPPSVTCDRTGAVCNSTLPHTCSRVTDLLSPGAHAISDVETFHADRERITLAPAPSA